MAIYHDVDQYSEAWDNLRIGVPTSSAFEKIITPTGKKSSQADTYLYHLVAERAIQRRISTYTSPQMEHGHEMEAEAVNYYELLRDVSSAKIGFVTNDKKTLGCSPDRLIGDDGLLEIKCPNPNTHMMYLLEGGLEEKYKPQLQGQLYITGRQWVDIISYHPEFPEDLKVAVIRVLPDLDYQNLLHEYLHDFLSKMTNAFIKLGSKLALSSAEPDDLEKLLQGDFL